MRHAHKLESFYQPCHGTNESHTTHTVDSGTRRKGGVMRQCLRNIVVGAIYVLILLVGVSLSGLGFGTMEIAITLVRTLYSQLRTGCFTAAILYRMDPKPRRFDLAFTAVDATLHTFKLCR